MEYDLKTENLLINQAGNFEQNILRAKDDKMKMVRQDFFREPIKEDEIC